MSLEGHTAERITFGVDSGAALTVIWKDVAAEYPRRVQGLTRRMTDCQGNFVVDLGQKDLALREPTGRSFARDGGVSSQEFAVGEFFVEDWARSCFQQWQELHPASEDRRAAADGGEE